MRDKVIRFAIIGCGRVAGHHSHSIDKIPQAKMAAFCDLVEERAAFLAKETNVPYYTNYHEMIFSVSKTCTLLAKGITPRPTRNAKVINKNPALMCSVSYLNV